MIDVPTVDLARCDDPGDLEGLTAVAREVDRACRDVGFFSVVGHGVDPALPTRLAALAREFFARPVAEKDTVAMRQGGTAWRGWFPLHGELTSGTPDHKEGYYFGRELGPTDARVRDRLPLHGPNLFPPEPAGTRTDRCSRTWTRSRSSATGSRASSPSRSGSPPTNWTRAGSATR